MDGKETLVEWLERITAALGEVVQQVPNEDGTYRLVYVGPDDEEGGES